MARVCRALRVWRLAFDEVFLPLVDFDLELDLAVLDLALAGLPVFLFLVAQASDAKSDRAANDDKKSRRFKYFLRRSQPAAETKRPCHLTRPLFVVEPDYNTSAAWSAKRERSPRCNVM